MTSSIRPLKLAIVGGGPSAFYAASRILSQLPIHSRHGEKLEVHMYDKLWAPHGLVRYGVAPDHPEVKNCIHKFDEVAEDRRFSFFGNVSVSQSSPRLPQTLNISFQDLFPHYTHLLLATGASQPQPLPPSIKSIPALEVVHWYTSHPNRVSPPPLSTTKHLTIIGHGNVSLDIARLILTAPSVLSKLDIPQAAIQDFNSSAVNHISIVSRRGPAEAAFTAKELRELLNLPNATMTPIDPSLLVTPTGATRQQSRILDLLRKGSVPKGDLPPDARRATWSLEFFRSPASTAPGEITFEITELDDQKRARLTGRTETKKTDLVITSVGSRSEPFSVATATSSMDPWYDTKLGRIRNLQGRVVDSSGQMVNNVYTSGWASNGAKGVIATTMYDAYSVADLLIADHISDERGTSEGISFGSNPMSALPKDGAPAAVLEGLTARGKARVITYPQWRRIDKEEIRKGVSLGKQRERISWSEVDAFLA
ncbi:NADPH-adrenodoxin reductase [Tulasnella sp. 419]|nr:NADPH-adrenodoxin reductase [Tulasnella sp. 419]